jgi:hypothetical protein
MSQAACKQVAAERCVAARKLFQKSTLLPHAAISQRNYHTAILCLGCCRFSLHILELTSLFACDKRHTFSSPCPFFKLAALVAVS